MNLSHINAYAQTKGYKDAMHCITSLHIERGVSLEGVAEELDMSVHAVRKLIETLHIVKNKTPIPLTVEDAKRMGPDAIAVKYKTSRSTAWRWKRAILRLAPDLEGREATSAPGADEG